MAGITVDTGINTKPVMSGARDLQKAINSLVSSISKVGKSLDVSVVGYAKAMQNNAVATQNFRNQMTTLENAAKGLRSQLVGMAATRVQTPEYQKTVKDIRQAETELRHLRAEQARMDQQGYRTVVRQWDRAAAIIHQNQQHMAALGTQEYRDYVQAVADMNRLMARGDDVYVHEYKNNRKALADTDKQWQTLVRQRENMRARGTDTQLGINTQEYKDAEKELGIIEDKMRRLQAVGNEALRPQHIKQWEDMRTLTGTVQEAFAKMAYYAKMTGYAITHPFQALNRVVPVVLSGLGAIGSKVFSVGASLARMVGTNVLAALRNLGSTAINAASGLARLAGHSAIAFLARLASSAKNAAIQLAKLAGNAVVSGLKRIASLAAQAGKAIVGLGKSAKGSNGNLLSSLKMMLKYSLGIRSLYMLFRKLRSAITDAFNNMAKKVPEFNKTLSSLASSYDRLKNSLATAFQPIVSAVAPYITQLMDLLSNALTKIGMFFAALTGQKYVYRATKAQIDYAKSLDKTKKSAKDAENQLADFDHLNILKDNSKSDKEETPTSDFEKIPVDSAINDFVSQIKDALKNGEFAKLGKMLAKKVNDLFAAIKWKELGKKIGKAINAIVDLFNGFMDNVKWKDIGKDLADGLDGILDTVNWGELGRAFAQKINAIAGIISGFVENTDWKKLGAKLAEAIWGYFGSIKWDLIGKTIGEAITGIATAIKEAAENFPWVEFGEKLVSGANAMFESIKWVEIADALIALLNGALDTLLVFLLEFDWVKHGEALANGIREFVTNIPGDKIGDALYLAILGILNFIGPALTDQETWKAAGQTFADMLNELFIGEGENNIWTKLATVIDGLVQGIVNGVGDFVATFEWGENGTKFHDAVAELVDNFPDNLGEVLSNLLSGALLFMGNAFGDTEIFNNLSMKLSTWLFDILTDEELWSNLGDTVNKLLLGILEFGDRFLTEFDKNKDTIAANIQTALGKIEWEDIATNTWNLVKRAFSTTGSFLDALFSEHVDPSNSDNIAAERMLEFNKLSLGTRMGEKIKQAFAKVPWEDVGKTLLQLAKDAAITAGDLIASLLNITEEDVKNAGGNKAVAIGTKLGEKIGEAVANIPWGTILETVKDTVLPLAQKTIDGLLSTENGTIFLALAGAFLAFKLGVVKLIAGLAGPITGALSGLAYTIAPFAAGVAAAFTIPYDLDKGSELFREFRQLIDENQQSVGDALRTYQELIGTKGKEVADAWAYARVQIDTSGMEVPEAMEAIRGKLEEESKQVWPGFLGTFQEYFESHSIGDAVSDAWHSFARHWHIESEANTPAISEDTKEAFAGAAGKAALLAAKEKEAKEAVDISVESFKDAAAERADEVKQVQIDVFSFDDVVEQSGIGGKNNANAYADAWRETVLETGQSEEALIQAQCKIFEATDPHKYGDDYGTQFYDGFRNKIMDDSGHVSSAFISVIEQIFTPAQIKALEEGNLDIETFYDALTSAASKLQPSASASFKAEMQALFDNVDAMTGGAATAEVYYDNFLNVVKDNGLIKYEYRQALTEIFGEAGMLAIERGKMSAQSWYDGWNMSLLDGEGGATSLLAALINRVIGYTETNVIEQGSPSKRSKRSGGWYVEGFEEGVEENIGSAETTTSNLFESLFGLLSETTKAGLQTIRNDVTTAMADVNNDIDTHSGTMGITVQTHLDGIGQTVRTEVDAIGRTVRTEIVGINDAVESGVSTQESTTARGAASITKPLQEQWEKTKDDITGFTGQMASDVSGGMSSMTADTMAGTTDQREEVYRNWDLIATYIKYSLLDMEHNIQSSMNSIYRIMYDGMNTISSMGWWVVGQNICYGIADGINSCWGWLNTLVWNLANSLFISAKNALGIRSPSKVFRDEVGYMLGAGLAEGIDDSQHTVLGSLTDMANAMVDEMQDTDLTADIDVNENRLLNGLDGALTAFTDNVENSFVRLTQRLQAIADTVTFVTPDIAAGTILPYAVQGDININTSDISTALDKNNEELISVIIQAANNQTSAIVQALMQYSSNNKGTDLTAATNYVIEEINRRTRAMGKSPLLI